MSLMGLRKHPAENVSCIGRFYWSWAEPSVLQPFISKAWANETEEPWRHGRGVAIRFGGRLLMLGLWKPSVPPDEDVHDAEFDTEVIRSW